MVIPLRDFSNKADFLGLIGQYTLVVPALLSQGASLLRIGPNVVDRFLLFYSNCTFYREFIKLNKVGNTQVHLRNGQFGAIPIPLPSLEEQKRIVAIVDSLMALCDRLEEQLESAESNKVALFESYLRQQDLGGRRTESQVVPPSSLRSLAEDKSSEQKIMVAHAAKGTQAPIKTLTEMLERLDTLHGESIATEHLLIETGLSDDVEKFFDLLREGRDAGVLEVPSGIGSSIKRK